MLIKINGTIVITIMLSLFSILFSHLTYAKECRIEGYSYAIDCIELRSEDEKSFSINVFQVPATVRYPHPEPIIWIPDGLVVKPRERAPTMISILTRVRAQRNLVWLEFDHPQKNVLLTCNPDAEMPELKVANISDRIDPIHSDEMLENCKHKLQLVDPNLFTYENIAATYEYSRKKLGLKQVVVVAEGRGAEIALAWQRLAPEAISFAVMDSPVFNKLDFNIEQAVSHENALKGVFNACRKSTNCKKNYPNPQQDFLLITEKLPQTIKVHDPLTLQSATIVMEDTLFLQAIQFLLRSPSRAKTLPMLLASAKNGDWQPFVGMLSVGWFRKNNEANLGLYLLESCKRFDETEFNRAQGLNSTANWFYKTGQKRLKRMCGVASPSPINSTIFRAPSLVLTGGVNPYRQKVLSFFQHKTVLDAKNAGANLLGYGCTKEVVYRYFQALESTQNRTLSPTVKSLDATCITNIPYPSLDNQPFFLKGAR